MLLHGRFAGLDEEVPEVLALKPEGRGHREQSLHELLARFRFMPEAAFAPEDGGPERLFTAVIRRLAVFHVEPGPQRGPAGQQVLTERLRGARALLGALAQGRAEVLLEREDLGAGCLPGELALSIPPPRRQELPTDVEPPAADYRVHAAAL